MLAWACSNQIHLTPLFSFLHITDENNGALLAGSQAETIYYPPCWSSDKENKAAALTVIDINDSG